MLSKLVLAARALAREPVDELSSGVAAPAKTFAERSSAMAATLAVAGWSGAVADSRPLGVGGLGPDRKRGAVGTHPLTDPPQLAFREEMLHEVGVEAAAEGADERPDHEALPAPATRHETEQPPGERRGQRARHRSTRVVDQRLPLAAHLQDDLVEYGAAARTDSVAELRPGMRGSLRSGEADQQHAEPGRLSAFVHPVGCSIP